MNTNFLARTFAAALLFGSPLMAFASTTAPSPSAEHLLRLSDRARGGGLPGLTWAVDIVTRGDNASQAQPTMKMRVKANDTASVAETLEPLRSRGNKMLQSHRNMWLTKPGLKKPIAISPRQRLTGQAAIGDIAATNYVRDYAATLLREDTYQGENCLVLDLQATNKQATYDRLHYWISKARGVAVHAQFLSLGGKPLKSADFEYGNALTVDGQRVPFVSRMTIHDAFTDAVTTLEYRDVRVQAIPASEFSISNFD